MDSQKIIYAALAVCWIVGIAGALILEGTYSDVKEMLPRLSVSEQRQDDFEKQREQESEDIARRLEQEQATVSKVLLTMQDLLSKHESKLAVIEHRTENSERERGDMASDIKTLLRIAHTNMKNRGNK
tara:strand:+ start:543 stop:926 length:384 start_codon:yes stop_codon:yes gene_type:complete